MTHGIAELLFPLFEEDIESYVYQPDNYSQISPPPLPQRVNKTKRSAPTEKSTTSPLLPPPLLHRAYSSPSTHSGHTVWPSGLTSAASPSLTSSDPVYSEGHYYRNSSIHHATDLPLLGTLSHSSSSGMNTLRPLHTPSYSANHLPLPPLGDRRHSMPLHLGNLPESDHTSPYLSHSTLHHSPLNHSPLLSPHPNALPNLYYPDHRSPSPLLPATNFCPPPFSHTSSSNYGSTSSNYTNVMNERSPIPSPVLLPIRSTSPWGPPPPLLSPRPHSPASLINSHPSYFQFEPLPHEESIPNLMQHRKRESTPPLPQSNKKRGRPPGSIKKSSPGKDLDGHSNSHANEGFHSNEGLGLEDHSGSGGIPLLVSEHSQGHSHSHSHSHSVGTWFYFKEQELRIKQDSVANHEF